MKTKKDWMEKAFFIKLIIINVMIVVLAIGLYLLMSDVVNMYMKDELAGKSTTGSTTMMGILAGTLGTPTIGLISLEIKLIFDYYKHKNNKKGDE